MYSRYRKIEHHTVIKFLTKQGKSQKIIHEEMMAVYQDSAPSLSTVQKWSSELKRGRESIEDDPRSGGPVTATTKENVKKIEKLVLEDAQIKIKMLAEMTNLSVGTICTIFHDHLNLSKVCARWVISFLKPQRESIVFSKFSMLHCCFFGLQNDVPLLAWKQHRVLWQDWPWKRHLQSLLPSAPSNRYILAGFIPIG
uniref:Mos1 transposase HTH domain-containing protein n=1 Tax=Varanus komodoensis TaxID=61221 RepID=A0A8D2LVX9_VARKO